MERERERDRDAAYILPKIHKQNTFNLIPLEIDSPTEEDVGVMKLL